MISLILEYLQLSSELLKQFYLFLLSSGIGETCIFKLILESMRMCYEDDHISNNSKNIDLYNLNLYPFIYLIFALNQINEHQACLVFVISISPKNLNNLNIIIN